MWYLYCHVRMCVYCIVLCCVALRCVYISMCVCVCAWCVRTCKVVEDFDFVGLLSEAELLQHRRLDLLHCCETRESELRLLSKLRVSTMRESVYKRVREIERARVCVKRKRETEREKAGREEEGDVYV